MTPYKEAWELQKRMQLRRLRNDDASDAVLIVQHPPVFTLGRGATEDNIRFDVAKAESGEVELHRIERGGEVTYHGPGQLVMYPILNLNRHKRDLHWYMRQCEEIVIRTIGDYGIEGSRDDEYTGVWVQDGKLKIAAMGFSVSRWVTMHGLALNVDIDLQPFGRIIPCGIDTESRGVTSLSQQLGGKNVNHDEVAIRMLRHFSNIFDLQLAISNRDREIPDIE